MSWNNRVFSPPPTRSEESWWVCPPEEFAGRCAQEQARLVRSRFGQAHVLTTGPNIDSDEARRSARRREQGEIL